MEQGGHLKKLKVTELMKNFLPFLEPEGSLPYSQKSTAGPYPQQLYAVHIFEQYETRKT
jgi:hypothetical protein